MSTLAIKSFKLHKGVTLRHYWFFLCICFFSLIPRSGFTLLEIEITQGVESALPMAITQVHGDTPIDAALLESVVYSNLYRSGLFSIIDKKKYPQQRVNAEQIDYEVWRNLGIEALLSISINKSDAGQVKIQFELFDLVRRERTLAHTVTVDQKQLRRASHKISDVVFEKLTGIKGAFSTRIAYISEIQNRDKKVFELQIADADGYGPKTIYSSPKQLMSPAWSPDGRKLAYVSFENDKSEIFIQDISTGQRSKLSSQPGINSSPVWSPNGKYLAMTLSVGGNPDIYIMELSTRKLTKLTEHYGIDTEAAWSHDGRSIVFTSNRSGSPQLYQIPVTGGTPTRLTFEGSYNAAASVSPMGDVLAMVHGGGKGYQIAIQNHAGSNFRILTEGTLDEAPSFAPNGSMIIYSTRYKNSTVLSAVSADGRVKQRLRLQKGKVREPVWSPFM